MDVKVLGNPKVILKLQAFDEYTLTLKTPTMEDIHGICISEQPWAITPNIHLHALSGLLQPKTCLSCVLMNEPFQLRPQKQLHTDNIL